MGPGNDDPVGILKGPETGTGGAEESQQEGAQKEDQTGESTIPARGDATFAFDLDPTLQLYEWILNVMILAISEAKENDKRIWIRKTPYPEMAWETLKSVIEEYKRNIMALNPEFTWDEFLDYTRKYLMKKAKEGVDTWGRA